MAGTGREQPIVITVADTPLAMQTVIELRRVVFGNEQRILLSRYEDPEDGFSLNLIASIGDRAVGTGRLTPAYDRAAVPTITWVATLPAYRNRGVGSAIVRALIDEAERVATTPFTSTPRLTRSVSTWPTDSVRSASRKRSTASPIKR